MASRTGPNHLHASMPARHMLRELLPPRRQSFSTSPEADRCRRSHRILLHDVIKHNSLVHRSPLLVSAIFHHPFDGCNGLTRHDLLPCHTTLFQLTIYHAQLLRHVRARLAATVCMRCKFSCEHSVRSEQLEGWTRVGRYRSLQQYCVASKSCKFAEVFPSRAGYKILSP